MMIDYNFITTLISIVAVLITLILFSVETRNGNLALKTDLLSRLDEKFSSREFRELRKCAARKLLSNEVPNYELSDLLDFFSSIGFLYERKAIDQGLAYHNFSYWMIRYWLSAKDYIEKERKIDPLGWKTLEKITIELMNMELKDGYPPYTPDLLLHFLKEEARFVEPRD